MRISDWSSDVCSSDLLADADLNKLVARTAPAVLVVDDAMLSRIAPVDGIELVARSDFEAEFIAGRPPARIELPEAENDIAVLLFTSGTTGEPKRSEEHTSELQSLMRISYAVFCLKKKNKTPLHSQTILRTNLTT